MGMNQPPPGKVPDLTDPGGKVSLRLIRRRPWLWRFLGICLLAALVGGPAVVGGPASLANGVYQETSPSAKVQNVWLTASVSVVAVADTITFVPVANQIVGATVTVSASSSSGLAVFLHLDTPSVCTVGGSTSPARGSTEAPVTTIAAGQCTIAAFDDSNYGGQATLSFQVQAAQTITFGPLPGVTVGAPVTLSASASSGLPVSFSSGTNTVCTVSGSAVTTAAAGLCTITASQGGSTDYAAASPVTQSFQVNPVNAVNPGPTAQTITFGQPPDAKVGAPVTLSASASSGLPVSFSSGTNTVCTVSGSAVTTAAAGLCTITASQGGSARYAAAPDVRRSFQVNPVSPGPAAQTITFGQPPDAKVGAPVTLSAHASSGLPVSFSSDTTPVCTVAGSVVTTVAAGPCIITASQGGSARYAAAPDVRQSFQVNPVPPKAAGVWVILLAAVILAAAAAAATMVLRRRRLRSHPPPAPAPAANVRAVPDTGPPGLVSVHNTGTDATHTVRIEPRPGTSITTIEEARP